MSIEGLEEKVIKWANKRDLYRQSTDMTRLEKFLEDEMFPPEGGPVDYDKVRMEAGDVLVTMVNLLHPLGLDLETCLSAAYEKIKDRTGHMENGTFVRDREVTDNG